jgi:peptidoglycan/LPS O-acetylase OafA/YrhL
MSRLLFVQETPIRVFYKRRVSRIFPTHVTFILLITIYHFTFGIPIQWPEAINAALFINNYFPGELGNAVMPFGHIWSLSVEEHSYIALSLIAVITRRKGWNPIWIIGIGCVISAVLGTWYWTEYSGKDLIGMWMHSEVAGYGIFISALFMLYFEKHRAPRLHWVVYPALVFAGMFMHWWSVPGPTRTFIGVGCLALAVNLLNQAPPLVKNLLSLMPLQKLGLWSFSIYLWQQPFYLLMHRNGMPSSLACLAAISCGVLSFHLIESPARKYLNRIWAREQTAIGKIEAQSIT